MDPQEPPNVIDLSAWKKKRDLVRLAESADWRTIAKKLTRYAAKRLGGRSFGDDPEDLAQEAIRHFFEHMSSWDPERVTLLRHLASVLNGIAIDRSRKGPNRWRSGKPGESEEPELPAARDDTGEANFQGRSDREDPHDPGRSRPAGLFCARPAGELVDGGVEDDIIGRDLATQVLGKTEQRLASDRLALDILALFARGIESPKEQCLALGGVALLDVLAARKRLERTMRRVRDEISHGLPCESEGNAGDER